MGPWHNSLYSLLGPLKNYQNKNVAPSIAYHKCSTHPLVCRKRCDLIMRDRPNVCREWLQDWNRSRPRLPCPSRLYGKFPVSLGTPNGFRTGFPPCKKGHKTLCAKRGIPHGNPTAEIRNTHSMACGLNQPKRRNSESMDVPEIEAKYIIQ